MNMDSKWLLSQILQQPFNQVGMNYCNLGYFPINFSQAVKRWSLDSSLFFPSLFKVMAVPVMQPGYTATVLTPADAPPMYTAASGAQMAAPQIQPMPTLNVQQPKEQHNWLMRSTK